MTVPPRRLTVMIDPASLRPVLHSMPVTVASVHAVHDPYAIAVSIDHPWFPITEALAVLGRRERQRRQG